MGKILDLWTLFVLWNHQFPHCYSVAALCPTLWPHGLQHTRPPILHYLSLFKFKSAESVMLSSHLILCRPLLLWLSLFPSIGVFSNELAVHIRCPKYWSFGLRISPSHEYSGLISFRLVCFDLLAVQGTQVSSLEICKFLSNSVV